MKLTSFVVSCHLTNTIISWFGDVGSASKLRTVIPISRSSGPFGFCSFQLELFLFSVVKLQRWWKGLLLLKLMNKSAIIIQSCTRGWIARRDATVYRRHVVIQVWCSSCYYDMLCGSTFVICLSLLLTCSWYF